jgi:valyl-tRNA synthetase
VLANLDGYEAGPAARLEPALADRWIRSRLTATVGAVRPHLRRYRFNDAAAAIYQFLWHEYCDWYLEIAKPALYRASAPGDRLRTQHTLVTVLEATLRLLHPFMPFITEEIWQRLPHEGESIMVAPYPRAHRRHRDPTAERQMGVVMDAITAIRNVRGEMRIAPGVNLEVTLRPAREHQALFRAQAALVETLARCRVTCEPRATRPPGSAFAAVGRSEIYVALAGVVDLAAEEARLRKEIERAAEQIAFLESKLGRREFVERAPAEVVTKERERLDEQRRLKAKLEASLAWISEGSR